MQQPQGLHLPGEPQVQTASFVLFLRIMGISQKQQGFGPRHQCAPDMAQGTEDTALNSVQSPSLMKLSGDRHRHQERSKSLAFQMVISAMEKNNAR